MQQPGIFHLRTVIHACGADTINPRTLPKRMTGQQHWTKRWHAAWLVWTGAADALVWEGSAASRKIWDL